jgi:Tfp pilus assembly protein PilO
MRTLKRVLAEKGLPLTVAAAVAVLGLGLYAFVVYPWTARVDSARQRELTASQNLAAAGQAHDAATAMANGKTRTNDQLERFYGDVLPSTLAEARGITYPRFAALAGAHNLVLEQRTSVPEQEEESQLARLRTTMRLGGEWPDIRRFIHALESAPEFIVIEGIELSQSEEDDSAQMLILSAVTYYQTGDRS